MVYHDIMWFFHDDMEECFFFLLGYSLQMLGSYMLIYKIYKTRSINCLCVDTQIALALATVCRAVWTHGTRLTEAKYATAEVILSTIAGVVLCGLCYQFRNTAEHDRSPVWLRIHVMLPGALVLSIVWNWDAAWISSQTLVAFSMYLESVALLPQLHTLKGSKEIETFTSHYVGLVVLARICRMIFWGIMWWKGDHIIALLLSDMVHSLLCADYLILWFKKMQTGKKMVYDGKHLEELVESLPVGGEFVL